MTPTTLPPLPKKHKLCIICHYMSTSNIINRTSKCSFTTFLVDYWVKQLHSNIQSIPSDKVCTEIEINDVDLYSQKLSRLISKTHTHITYINNNLFIFSSDHIDQKNQYSTCSGMLYIVIIP